MDAPLLPLYMQLADRMARSIRAGTLKRGERLPSVRELAGQHGVSLSTAVQAYRWREDARLIEARPRSGYFVAARPPRLPEPRVSRPDTASRMVQLDQLGAQVMALSQDPAFISFGAACPGPELFDQDRVRRAMARAVMRHRELLCTYPIGPGMEEARRAVARASRFHGTSGVHSSATWSNRVGWAVGFRNWRGRSIRPRRGASLSSRSTYPRSRPAAARSSMRVARRWARRSNRPPSPPTQSE